MEVALQGTLSGRAGNQSVDVARGRISGPTGADVFGDVLADPADRFADDVAGAEDATAAPLAERFAKCVEQRAASRAARAVVLAARSDAESLSARNRSRNRPRPSSHSAVAANPTATTSTSAGGARGRHGHRGGYDSDDASSEDDGSGAGSSSALAAAAAAVAASSEPEIPAVWALATLCLFSGTPHDTRLDLLARAIVGEESPSAYRFAAASAAEPEPPASGRVRWMGHGSAGSMSARSSRAGSQCVGVGWGSGGGGTGPTGFENENDTDLFDVPASESAAAAASSSTPAGLEAAHAVDENEDEDEDGIVTVHEWRDDDRAEVEPSQASSASATVHNPPPPPPPSSYSRSGRGTRFNAGIGRAPGFEALTRLSNMSLADAHTLVWTMQSVPFALGREGRAVALAQAAKPASAPAGRAKTTGCALDRDGLPTKAAAELLLSDFRDACRAAELPSCGSAKDGCVDGSLLCSFLAGHADVFPILASLWGTRVAQRVSQRSHGHG
jgi:hypothetical protein